MKLEGRMIGPWVEESRQAWRNLSSSLSRRKLSIDLCGVTFVDEEGLELLQEIYGRTRAAVVSNSPLTKHFAEQVMGPTSKRRRGE